MYQNAELGLLWSVNIMLSRVHCLNSAPNLYDRLQSNMPIQHDESSETFITQTIAQQID